MRDPGPRFLRSFRARRRRNDQGVLLICGNSFFRVGAFEDDLWRACADPLTSLEIAHRLAPRFPRFTHDELSALVRATCERMVGDGLLAVTEAPR